MKSLKEQITGRCIHFNGLRNQSCKIGVNYDDVKIKDTTPFKIPCLKDSRLTGGHCDKQAFVSEQEAQRQTDKILDRTNQILKVRNVIRKHADEHKIERGVVKCPSCKGDLSYVINNNGHIWGKCAGCTISFME